MPTRSLHAPLVRASSLVVLQRGLQVLSARVSVPLTLSYLVADRFGLWRVVTSLMPFMGILEAGITAKLRNQPAEANADHNEAVFETSVPANSASASGAQMPSPQFLTNK